MHATVSTARNLLPLLAVRAVLTVLTLLALYAVGTGVCNAYNVSIVYSGDSCVQCARLLTDVHNCTHC